MLQRLTEFRVIQGQQRAASQLVDEISEPHRGKRNRERDVKPVKVRLAAMREGRRAQPVHVDETHHQDERRHLRHHGCVSLDGAVEQHQERHGEMKNDESQRDVLPPWPTRCRYHSVSSGMFAAQMIRYCEKPK